MSLDSHDRPIFVVGAPRSGTTLFQYMLRSHPNISLPTGESHFLVPLFRRENEFLPLSQRDNMKRLLEAMYEKSANFLDTDLHGLRFDIERLADEFVSECRDTLQSVFVGLFEKNARGEGKIRWGDKTPYYVLQMELLLDRFPGAQFIHLIRDGRDVALSLFDRRHDFGVYNTFFAAKYWEIYVERGQRVGRNLGIDVYHEVRFEDLVQDPVQVMRSVCTFLNEPYSENLINFRKSGEAGKTPLLQQPIQQSNKEKWRSKMSSRQIAVFEGAVGETLKSNGYPLATTAQTISVPMKATYRLHNEAARRVHQLRRRLDRAISR